MSRSTTLRRTTGPLGPLAACLLFAMAVSGSGCLTDVAVGGGPSPATTEANDDGDCEAEGDCPDECDPGCDGVLEVCNGGVCACRLGLVACAGACVDTMSDPRHCGACGNACSEACSAGRCVSTCGSGSDEQACAGACVDVDEHPLHCGECDEPCEANEACSNGECLEVTGLDCLGDEQCSAGSRCCESGFFDARVCVEASECP